MFNFTIRVGDNTNTASNTPLVLVVNANSGLQILTSSLPQGQVGTGYNSTLAATGGSPGYFWDGPVSGSLPNGLTISSNGNILGSPTLAGNFTFVIRVRDGNGFGSSALASFSIRINSNVLTIGTTSLPNGSLGAFYSQTLSISGGAQPYSITRTSGSLPPGIELQGSGVLAGTPTAIGTSNFVVQVTDANNSQFSRPLSITIGAQQFAINQTPLPTGQVGVAYSASVTASGRTAPYIYSILNGSLPTGIAFTNGSFSGTPSVSGSFPLTIQARDNTNATVSANFSLVVNSTSLILSTTSLPNAVVNQSYFATITASGGQQPYTFSVVSGQLPPGISLSSGGSFSGGTSTAGQYQFTVRVTDALGAVTQSLFELIASSSNLSLQSTALPNAQLNQPYTASLSASGGSAPYVFTIVGGALPQGLTLATNGSISGTPTAPGSFQVTFRVQDSFQNIAQATITLQVNSFNFRITTSSLASGRLGQPYSGNVIADGGTPAYLFILVAGQLPPGIGLSLGGVLSGTPTVAGNYSFTVRASDNASRTAEANFSISINSSNITLTNTSLPAAQLNQSYSTALSASGGTAPFTFSVVSGSIPAGMSLSTAGVISGTPTVSGTFNFAVQVRDNVPTTAVFNLSLVVGNSAIAITTTSLPNGSVGVFYSNAISAANGLAPYNFSLNSGTLPSGLILSSSGVISGTPNVNGNFSFAVRVTDSQGNTATANLSLQVGGTGTLDIVTSALNSAQINVFYSATVSVSGGAAPYSFSIVSGQLPPGLSLLSNGGISGTPTAGGNFTFILRVVDGFGSSTQRSLSISVNSSGLSITTATIPNVQLGQFFSIQFAALGGSSPYTWSLASGTLPTGVSLSPQGILSGLPATGGGFEFAVRVTDITGLTAQKVFNLAIGQSSLQFSTASLPNASLGQNYSLTLVASGGTSPYTFSLASGSLAPGIGLSPSGILSGIATTAGVYSFTLRVQDSANAIVNQNFTLNVLAGNIQITTASLPAGRVNQAYLQTIQTTGGVAPIRLEILSTINSGFPPPGLTLSIGGVLSGTPQTAGTYTFTVRAIDAQNLTAQATYQLVVSAAAPVITTSSLPSGTVGSNYGQTISASGGAPPYTFSLISGTAPPPLLLSPAGTLSGTPNQAGTFTFTIRVSDAAQQTVDATYSVEISAGKTPLTISALAPPAALTYVLYNFTLSASGGTLPYTWSILAGPIPNGLRLDANGVLNGLPLAPGTYRFTARVVDSLAASAETSVVITVAAPLRLPSGQVNVPYTAQAPTPVAGRPPFTYTLNANALGDLPVGVSLSSGGVFSGTPTTAGEYTFGLVIRDASSFTSNATVTLSIAAPPGLAIETPSLPGGTIGTAYNQTLSAKDGQAPYNWALVSGNLPNGLSLNPSTGQVSGNPTQQGTTFFVARVTDAAGTSVTAYFGISIASANTPVLSAITSVASYGANGVAPGELIVLFGGTLGPVSLSQFGLVNNALPTVLSGTRVLFDGVPAPLIYSLTGQVSAIAPFSISDRPSTRIVAEYQGVQSTPFILPVVSSKPALFTVDSSGQGPGAILNQDGSVNTEGNRAGRESVVVLYATGAGEMTPAGQAGRVAAGISSLNQQTLVSINGTPANVLYSGNAPGLVEGVVQINVRLPSNTVSGQNSIRLQVGPNATTANVSVWVQ